MSDKVWADFNDYVLPFANAPKIIAERATLLSCKEFLDITLTLRSLFDEFATVADQSEYSLAYVSEGIGTASGQYETISIVPKTVYIGTSLELFETTEDALENRVYNWLQQSATNPTHYFQTWDRKMRMYPTPSAVSSSNVSGEAYITITEAAVGVFDVIYNRWKEHIGYGAVARLLRMPNQQWSDLSGAEYFDLKYRQAKSRAKSIVNKGRTTKPTSVRPVDTFLIA